MYQLKFIFSFFIIALPVINSNAQGHISFQCQELNISKSETLKCDPMSEDDPNDLAEAWAKLITYFPENYKGTDQSFELSFPTRVGSYHWVQKNKQDKNDSLAAHLYYNFNPNVYGQYLDAFPKDFTITITHYDGVKGGVIEGRFEGTMEAFTAWNHSNVSIPVKGDFHTIRNGSGWEERKQRSAEKEVIGKAINVCDEVLTQPLQNSGWKINERTDGRNTMIANNAAPFRPMFCNDLFDLKLTVDPLSNYGKMLNDSAEYYGKLSSQNTDDYKAIGQAVRNMARIQNMNHIEISTDVNDPYLKENHFIGKQDKLTVLHIPGVAYAYQTSKAAQNDLDPPDEKTYLCFGNWAGADANAKTYEGFPFIHKRSAPAIENIVITISGPADAANEIIKEINWSKINEALNK
jgi:hypothetical protein